MKKILLPIFTLAICLLLNLGVVVAEDFELSTNRKSPSTNQFVNLTIETDDDYIGKLTFSVKYRSSSSSSWSSISSLTSSTYFSDYSSTWSNGYYRMTSSDDGEVTLKNLVKFKKKGDYRVYVKDTDGDQKYIQFSVGENYTVNEDLKLSISPNKPDTNERVKLTIKTDDDYVGKVNFTIIQYKSNSSSSWSNITRTSSTYISDYSTEWSNGYYKMTSSDDGEKIISKFIKFKKKGYYRIFAEDINGNSAYIEFSVNSSSSSSSSNDDIKLSTNRKSPSTNQFINLTIKTDDDYVGKLTFSAKYRSSSSSSWSSISNLTSSTYFSDYSDEWDDGYYKMRSSDDGEVTLKNLVKFKKKGYYRIYVKDTDGNSSYIDISVDSSSSSSSSSNDDIELSTNRKSPSTNQFINLTIETDDDYVGKLTFSAKYRSSSSSSWSSISNLTSSTYFSDYSDEREDGYYKMRSSDDGEVTLKNLVKFRKKGYYRIYVKDADGNQSYIQFSVGGGNDDDYDSPDDSDSYVDGFSEFELSKVKGVYKNWKSMVAEMQRLYPRLKKDIYWIQISNNMYDDLKDVANNKKVRDFDDYQDFEKAFQEWYKYTMTNV